MNGHWGLRAESIIGALVVGVLILAVRGCGAG